LIYCRKKTEYTKSNHNPFLKRRFTCFQTHVNLHKLLIFRKLLLKQADSTGRQQWTASNSRLFIETGRSLEHATQ